MKKSYLFTLFLKNRYGNENIRKIIEQGSSLGYVYSNFDNLIIAKTYKDFFITEEQAFKKITSFNDEDSRSVYLSMFGTCGNLNICVISQTSLCIGFSDPSFEWKIEIADDIFVVDVARYIRSLLMLVNDFPVKNLAANFLFEESYLVNLSRCIAAKINFKSNLEGSQSNAEALAYNIFFNKCIVSKEIDSKPLLVGEVVQLILEALKYDSGFETVLFVRKAENQGIIYKISISCDKIIVWPQDFLDIRPTIHFLLGICTMFEIEEVASFF